MTFQKDSPPDSADFSRPADFAQVAKSLVDVPLDAIVYDVHPATVDIYQPEPLFHFQTPAQAEYKVPQRFGMAAIFGIMTALAILFGGFRLLSAEPVVYLFFGIQSVVICLVQMFIGKAPRIASAVTGAVMAPFFAVGLIEATGVTGSFSFGERTFWTVVMIPLSAPIGAFLGYLTGTCAAGIFLVMDYLELYSQGSAFGSITHPKPTP